MLSTLEIEYSWLVLERQLLEVHQVIAAMDALRARRSGGEDVDLLTVLRDGCQLDVEVLRDLLPGLKSLPMRCPSCGGKWRIPQYDPARSWPCPQCETETSPYLAAIGSIPEWPVPGRPTRSRPRLTELARERRQASAATPTTLEAWVLHQETVGNYQLRRLLGRTSTSMVFRGQRIDSDTPAAIKVLVVDDETMRKRMLREAEVLGRINHPNVVRVYEAADTDHVVYVAMELADGVTFSQLLRDRGVLDLPTAMEVVGPVLAGLSAVHAAGVVHRDVKPANIMVGSEVRLIDFSLSRVDRDTAMTRLTESKMTMGTPYYIAPEQLRDSRVDQRADLYSVGAILYEALTGKIPHDAPEVETLISGRLRRDPPAPSEVSPELDPLVDAPVMHLLARHPDDRTPTADDALRELNDAVQRLSAK